MNLGSCFGIKARDCVQSVLRFCLLSSTISLVQIHDAAMSRMISDPEGAADELGYGRDDC